MPLRLQLIIRHVKSDSINLIVCVRACEVINIIGCLFVTKNGCCFKVKFSICLRPFHFGVLVIDQILGFV